MATVRYEVRYQTTAQANADWMHPGEVIHVAHRALAIATGRALSCDDSIAHVEVWQVGTDGGEAATATGLIWSVALANSAAAR